MVDLESFQKLKRSTIGATVLAAAVGVSGAVWLVQYWSDASSPVVLRSPANARSILALPGPQSYKPLLPEQAKVENDRLPFSEAPIEQALPLVLPFGEQMPIDRRNAIDCLTSAIYYEAGNEIDQGKRAVAQVILNRVRHPAYPKTVCGVVYQGSERKTGCQFTFTCDGSLARRPPRDRWERARMMAIGAISGAVEPSVGMSTHYHANYVLPYWASSLDKVSQIGAHIFYRWKGNWGRRKAFTQAVQLETEALPSVIFAEVHPALDETPLALPSTKTITSRILADEDLINLQPNRAPKLVSPEASRIHADDKRSTLLIDEKLSSLNAK